MNSAEIDYHKRKVQEIEADFQEFSQQVFKFYETKKDLLLEWAKQLEALIVAGQVPITAAEICAYITSRLRELETDISERWVRETLPAKYKRTYEKTESAVVPNAPIVEVPKEYQKPIAVMNNGEVQDALEFYDEQAKESARRKSEYNEKVQELIDEARNRRIAITKVDRPVVSTRKEPGLSKSYDLACELVEVATGIRDKIHDFPPAGQDDEALALSLEQLILFLRPMQDEKWTKSLVEWFKVQLENIAHGKHAAGSRQASITLMGDKRNMTREQVGDRFEEIMKMACKITGDEIPDESDGDKQDEILKRAIAKAAAHPQVNRLAEWHKKYVEPRIAQRKVDKHDDFSEAA